MIFMELCPCWEAESRTCMHTTKAYRGLVALVENPVPIRSEVEWVWEPGLTFCRFELGIVQPVASCSTGCSIPNSMFSTRRIDSTSYCHCKIVFYTVILRTANCGPIIPQPPPTSQWQFVKYRVYIPAAFRLFSLVPPSQYESCSRTTRYCKHYCLLSGYGSSGMFRRLSQLPTAETTTLW